MQVALSRLKAVSANVSFGDCLIGASVTALVKVFGCRPSQTEREAWGRRTETAQARTRGVLVRRYGDLRILVRLDGWGGVCEMRFARRGWW